MEFWRFATPDPVLGPPMVGAYNLVLVGLSVLVASVAAYTALSVIERIQSIRSLRLRRAWLAAGAVSMGGGVWAMHFTGMLAYSMHVETGYSLSITLASAVPAILASGFALHILARASIEIWRLQLGALTLASGIGTMHYIGMEAMQMDAVLFYNPGLFALSIVVAHILASIALYARFALTGIREAVFSRLLAGALMGCSVACMHYTAMSASEFYPGDGIFQPGTVIPTFWLATGIITVVSMIMATTLLGATIDQRLSDASATINERTVRFRTVLDTMIDSVVTFDLDGEIGTLNPAAVAIFGADEDTFIGRDIRPLIGSEAQVPLEEFLMQFAGDRPRELNQLRIEDDVIAINGQLIPAEIMVNPMVIDGAIHFTMVVRDITERRQSEKKIQALAYYDSLTELPNRNLFQDRLKHGLEAVKRHRSKLGLLFLDLNHFKKVNDSLGHSAGDVLLQEIAVRLKEGIRSGDTVVRSHSIGSTTLARLGGDEFTVILPQLSDAQDAAKVAQRLMASVSKPIVLEGQEVYSEVSIGIAVAPEDGEDAETLLRNADSAMYHAKSVGGNHLEFYGESMNVDAKRKLRLASQLHRALENQEFVLHYQPVCNAVTGKPMAAEALLRWNVPEEGLVPPDEFIPFAEDTGLIVPIGEWVLRTACAQARAWQDAGFRSIRMAVNVSTHQLRQPGWFQTVVQTLEETGLSPAHLEIELTESAILHHDHVAVENLRLLDEMGIGLALDDFGTGYSSLSYLQRFPVHRLKIDRSFVQEIATGQDAPLAEAILAMAKSLKLNVVAEGVETEYQAEYLCAHGCDELQGYLLGRPVPAEDFLRFLEKEKNE